METVFEKLHYHGTNVYRHAKKHHRKYLLGVAGFFGLVKIFSFLLVSISGYMLTSAYLQPEGIQPFIIGSDNFQFFIGDQNCNQIQETRGSPPEFYVCVTGSKVADIQTMRFSMISEADLKTHQWMPFFNAAAIQMHEEGEGKKYIYAQYGYSADNYAIVKNEVDITKMVTGPFSLVDRTITMGDTVDLINRYLIIKSPESMSQVTINTAGETGKITVAGGDWYGIINPPMAITDKREASKGEPGLPGDFSAVQTFAVGANGVKLIADATTRFNLSFQITEPKTNIGETLDIYYSDDGASREPLSASCIVDSQRICNISTAQLGIFAFGRNDILTSFTTGTTTTAPTYTGNFRENNIDDAAIIASFFGTGRRDNTYTTHFSKDTCAIEDMKVIRLSPGSGTIPKYPYGNTIYLLERGTYISPYMTDIMETCTAIVGVDTGVDLYTSSKRGANIKISYGEHIIINNINVYGENDGSGGTHTPNNYGIFVGTTGNKLYAINAYSYGGYGVYLDDFDNIIGKIKSYKSESKTIYPLYDTSIDANNQDKNFGASDQLVVDESGSKALIRFNLGDIPASAKISEASLSLTKLGGTSKTASINRILNNSRVEGVSDGISSISGEPDYLHSAFPDAARYGGVGMVASKDYDIKEIIEDTLTSTSSTTKAFSFNAYGIATLQERMKYPELNQGLVISTDNAYTTLASKEWKEKKSRPTLTLTYQYENPNARNAPVMLPLTEDEESIQAIMLQQGYSKTGDIMRGINPIDLSMSQGRISVPITIESADDGTTITFAKGTQIQTKEGSGYGGVLIGPKNISLATLSGRIPDEELIKAFKIGSPSEQLLLEDAIGNTQLAEIKVPLNGEISGTRIIIQYTSDGEKFDKMKSAVVQEQDGKSYIIFTTNHFTTFILGKSKSDCSLVINDDTTLTQYATVMLQPSCKDAKRIRFSNLSYADLSGQERIAIQSEYMRSLAGINGTNTVYAEFDNGTGTITTDDSIRYSPKGPVMGNGMIEHGEQCDDSDTESGDGCSSTGVVESGFICAGEPTICERKIQPELLVTTGTDLPSTGSETISTPGTEIVPSTGKEIIPTPGGAIIPPVPEVVQPSAGDEIIQISPQVPTDEMNFIGIATLSPSVIARGKKILLDTPITVHSNSRILGSLSISGIQSMEISGADRNGKISAPQMLNHTDKKSATKRKKGISPKDKIIQTVKVGNATTDLVPFDGVFDISFESLEGNPGEKYSIMHSLDGETWSENVFDTTCVLDDSSVCNLESDALGYFALVQKGVEKLTYLNDAFWEANPDATAITTTIFGNTTYPSLYTSNRSSGAMCNPASINIEYLSPDTFDLTTTKANTIYVLASGAYNISTPIVISGGCSAIIGQGKVKLSSNNALDHFIDIQASRVVVDNLSINGNTNNQQSIFGILADNQKDITLNTLELFNLYDAIKLSNMENISISNAKIFAGITPIAFENSKNILLDNDMIFNSTRGFTSKDSSSISINNSQFFNNNESIGITNSTGTIINNSAIYSSKTGLVIMQSYNIIFNNVGIYNNDQIAQVSGSQNLSYQGTLRMFSNSGQNQFSNYGIETGKKSKKNGYGFDKGDIDDTPVSGYLCDRSSNLTYYIDDTQNEYLLQNNNPINGCSMRGRKTNSLIVGIKDYIYGDILPSRVPVIGYENEKKIRAYDITYETGTVVGKRDEIKEHKVVLPTQADVKSIAAQLKDKGGFKTAKDGKSLEGFTDLDFSRSKGKLLNPIIHTSDSSKDAKEIAVRYQEGTMVKSKGREFTGVIVAPRYLSKDEILAKGAKIKTGTLAVELGDATAPITFEDEKGNPVEVDVEVEVPKGYYFGSGDFSISSSEDGKTWKPSGTGSLTNLSGGRQGVKFRTNHFSVYTFDYGATTLNIGSPDGGSWYGTAVDYYWYFTTYSYSLAYYYPYVSDENCGASLYQQNAGVDATNYGPVEHTSSSSCIWYMSIAAYEGGGYSHSYDSNYAYSPAYTYASYKIDGTLPTSAFNSTPASGSTQSASFYIGTPTDSDAAPSSSLARCYYDVYDNGTMTVNQGSRTCNSSQNITVGAGQNCNTGGPNKCRVDIRARDSVNNYGTKVSRSYTINTDSTPPVTSIGASSPASGTYYSTFAGMYFTDTDNVGFGTCYYTVRNGSTTLQATGTRTCGTDMSVGTSNCTTNGKNVCTFYGWSVDTAGNTSATTGRSYSIDTVAPTVTWSSPAAGACLSGTATYSFTDYDAQGLASCHMTINNTYGFPRTCNTPLVDTNTALRCADGSNTCSITGDDIDMGSQYGYSAVRVFSVDTTGPTTPSLGGGGTYATATPNLTWGASTDAGAGTCAGTVRYDGIVYTDNACATQSQTISLTTSANATISSMADGTHSYKIRAVDIMGNYGSYASCATFIIDTTKPVVGSPTITAAGGLISGSFFKGAISLGATATDASNSLFCRYTTNGSRASPISASRATNACSTTSISPGASITVNFKAADIANNSGYGTTGTFTYDATAPVENLFLINGSSAAIISGGSFNVSLSSLGGTEAGVGLAKMQFSCDNANYTTPQTYATTATFNVTGAAGAGCSTTQGTRYVYFKLSDWLANTGNSSSVGFLYDSIAPTVTQVTAVPSPANNTTPSYTFASNSTGTIIYGGSCSSATTTVTTSGNNTITFNTLAAGTYSNCTITVRDLAGNTSTPLSVNTFIIDTSMSPGTISVNNGQTYASGTTLTLTLSASDPNGMGQMQFSCNNSTFSTAEAYSTSKSFPLGSYTTQGCSTSDGSQIVYVKFSDVAGNRSTSSNDSIVLDTTKPYLASSPSFGGWYTSAQSAVRGYADATAGINSFSATGCTLNEGNPATCNTTPSVTDNAGNNTGGVQYGASAYVDLSNPSVGAAIIAAGNFNLGYYKGAITLMATATDTIGVTSCQYTTGSRANAATATCAAGSGSSSISPTTTITVSFRAYDASTRVGYGATGTFYYDATPPYLSSYSAIDTVKWWSGNQTQTFTYTDAGAGGSWTNPNCIISTEGNPATCTIANPNICDYLSNCNTTSVTSSGIKLDKTAPTTSFTAGTSKTGNFTLAITDSDTISSAAFCYVRILSGSVQASGRTPRTCGATITIPAATYCPANGTNNCTVIAYSIDSGGNTSAYYTGSFSMSYDVVPPLTTISSPAGGTRYSGGLITGVFADSDTGAGLNQCFYRVINNGSVTLAWTARTCNTTAPGISVASYCSTNGTNICTIYGYATDNVGNTNSGSSISVSVSIDTVHPTVTLTDAIGTYASGAFLMTGTFDSAVTGFTGGDISGTNATFSNVTAISTSVYQRTVTPSGQGAFTVTILTGVAVGAVGNPNDISATASATFDSVKPSVTLTTGTLGATFTGTSFLMTGTFDSAVTGFTGTDITCSNCTLSTVTAISTSVYQRTVTPTAQGAVSISIAAGGAVDVAGNSNNASNTINTTFDNIKPSVTLTTGTLGAYFTGASFLVTGTFDTAVIGFTGSDVTCSNCTLSTVTAISTTVYQRTVTPTAQGAVSVSIAAGVAADGGGNSNNASTNTINTTYDSTAPTVTTGSIYSGMVGFNGTLQYYDGPVDISGTVTDVVGLSGNTCKYTTGQSWVAATYVGNSTAGYCYKSGLNFTSTLNLRFSIQDAAGQTTTGATGIYLYDNTGPSVAPTLVIPTSGQYLATGTVVLQRGSGTDAGVGMSGYYYQISTGATFAVISKSGTVVMATGTTVMGLADNMYYRRVYGFDDLLNTGAWSSTGIFYADSTPPTVTTGYIYSGFGGYNGNTGYYYGTIDISGSVNDSIGISGNTCKYTTGASWLVAAYSGTNTTGYCYTTGVAFTTTLNIRFSVQNTAGWTTTGATGTYLYDNGLPTAPTTVAPTSGQVFATGTVTFQRSSGTDAAIGVSGYVYQISTGSAFSLIVKGGTVATTGLTVTGLADNSYYRRVYTFDRFTNQSAWSNLPTFRIDLLAPSIINVSSTTATGSYNSGKIIIQVKFSEPVFVNTGGGRPILYLNSKTF